MFGIMTPSAIATLALGIWLWLGYGFAGNWLILKLLLTGLVVIYHFWCYLAFRAFQNGTNVRSHLFYRWMNEVPVLCLIAIVILVVVKPL